MKTPAFCVRPFVASEAADMPQAAQAEGAELQFECWLSPASTSLHAQRYRQRGKGMLLLHGVAARCVDRGPWTGLLCLYNKHITTHSCIAKCMRLRNDGR